MIKFAKSYSGGSLRSLLIQYSTDRGKVDPQFKAEFDAARAEERRLRIARQKAAEENSRKAAA